MEICAHTREISGQSAKCEQNHARDAAQSAVTALDTALVAVLGTGPALTLEPHVCRHCMARLVSRPIAGDLREYECTNCGSIAQHTDPTQVCCCGIKIRKRNGAGRSGGPMVDAGIRCIANPQKSAAFPALYVAAEVAAKR